MTLDLGNTDKLNLFRQELDRLGITLLPPDINRSRADLHGREPTARDGKARAIRYALAAVKNVGAGAWTRWSPSARRTARSRDLVRFRRAGSTPSMLNKRQLENLAAAGAFDSPRPEPAPDLRGASRLILRHAERAAERARQPAGQPVRRRRAGRARRRFAAAGGAGLAAARAAAQRVRGDRLLPLGAPARRLRRARLKRARRRCASAIIAGWLARGRARPGPSSPASSIGKQERTSARGNRFAFVQLSDPSGMFEVTVFSDLLARRASCWSRARPLLVTADVRSEEDSCA